LLKEAAGKLTSVAYIQSADTKALAWYPRYVQTVTAAATALHVRIQFIDVESADEFELTIRRLAQHGVDGVVMVGGGVPLRRHAAQLAAVLIAHRLPSLGDPEDGFLLRYSFSSKALARAAADYVDKIFRGALPAELPVEQVSAFDLSINLRTARALGLTIPQALLMHATEVIE
jgi:putative ABC transport system substrate-binding protein